MNTGDRVRVKLTTYDADQEYTLAAQITYIDRFQGVFMLTCDNGKHVAATVDDLEPDREPELTDFYVGQEVRVDRDDHTVLGSVTELQDTTGYVVVDIDDEYPLHCTPDELEAI